MDQVFYIELYCHITRLSDKFKKCVTEQSLPTAADLLKEHDQIVTFLPQCTLLQEFVILNVAYCNYLLLAVNGNQDLLMQSCVSSILYDYMSRQPTFNKIDDVRPLLIVVGLMDSKTISQQKWRQLAKFTVNCLKVQTWIGGNLFYQ